MSEKTIPEPDVTTAKMSQEQINDFAELESLAAEGSAPADQAQAAAVEQMAINQVDELTGILFTAGNILSVKFPSLGKVYVEERCRKVAESLNPVFEKLGWNITGGDFAIYAGALIAVGMLAKDTKDAIQEDLKAAHIEAENEAMIAAGLRTA